MPRNARLADVLAAGAVAVAAFAIYHATLLPGFDFGDTGSLQTTAGSTLVTPRVGYPLYFAIANTWLRVVGGDPAHALNLASAVEAALACGLAVLVAVELSGSIVAAAAAALMFAVSYTFWSQAIIAEVYALHICLVAFTLLLLLRWANRPTMLRLALFFAVYAAGFGNHLSMVLLAPAYTLFLLVPVPALRHGDSANSEPSRAQWTSESLRVTPRVVLLAVGCAALGASQYAWNLRALWFLPQPPHSLLDGLQTFWFDVTKSDWRDTMVLHVPRSMLADHARMYWFDLRQQLGPAVPLLALAGLAQLAMVDARRAMLMALLFAANVLFAFSYNVGDSHVFYLPSHFVLALLVAPGLALVGRLTARAAPVAAALVIAYAGTRAYRDFPALDRSADTRPAAIIGALTAGLDGQQSVLLTDLNWQVSNGLSYFAKVLRPALVHARMPDVLLYAPALVEDNRAVGREVVLTERARVEVDAAYGPLLPVEPDARALVLPLSARVAGLPAGTPYALCVLKPSPDFGLDTDDLARALGVLIAGAADSVSPPTSVPAGDYAVVAGVTGRPPDLVFGSDLPFTTRIQLGGTEVAGGDGGHREGRRSPGGTEVEIRMESWLSADTIRRMGFGHVIAEREHILIVERGVSFAAFDRRGRVLRMAYAANVFAPQRRYLIRNPATP